jgi:fucose permease
MTKLIFGGLIAIILLGLYAYATVYAVLAAQCLGGGGCTEYSKDLNEGVVTILNLVGGLVSALVIAQLAITDPKAPPGTSLVDPQNTSDLMKKTVTIVSTVYVAVWVACGLAALVVGYLRYPNVVPQLTASAKSWLGLAVAAAYSSLGLRRPSDG